VYVEVANRNMDELQSAISYQSQNSASLLLTVAGSSSSSIAGGGKWQGNALRKPDMQRID